MSSREPKGPGYELRDVDFRRVAIAGIALIVGSLLALVAMAFTFKYFAAREAESQPPRASLVAPPSDALPPEPRLQTTPFDDIRTLRAAEDAELGTYGWIDRKAGIARIPIDRAIEILAERGLPSRPSGPAVGAAHGDSR